MGDVPRSGAQLPGVLGGMDLLNSAWKKAFLPIALMTRIDLRNSQLIVMWGGNPAWSAGGNPTYNYL